MRIRAVWPKCDLPPYVWAAQPLDAYWVEASEAEAIAEVFPYLTPHLQAASREYGLHGESIARALGTPPLPYCFLVASDLSVVVPMQTSYPVSNLWNGESPFEYVPEIKIAKLNELLALQFPSTIVQRGELHQ